MPSEKLTSLDGGEPSSAIRARVEASRAVQAERFAPLGKPYVLINGDMGPTEVQRFCEIDEVCKSLMRAAMRQMDLSERSYHRVLKLARTIAELAGKEAIKTQHLAGVIQCGGKIDYCSQKRLISAQFGSDKPGCDRESQRYVYKWLSRPHTELHRIWPRH